MLIEVTAEAPEAQPADLLAVPFTGAASALVRRLGDLVEARLSRLIESGEAKADPGTTVLVYPAAADGLAATRLALVGVGDADEDDVRTAASTAVRAARSLGGTLVWAFDVELGLGAEAQTRAVVEGVVIGGHDPARWKTTEPARGLERLAL